MATIDFDSKARQWDTDPDFIERGRKLAAMLRARVRLDRSMTALDYGCGTGLLSFPLRDALGRVTLVDSSAGMLAVVREKIAAQGVSNMTVLQADLAAGALPDERYDLVYTSMTLHHVRDTEAILRAFHALLRPGGHLCVADLDLEDGSFHGAEIEVHHGFDREALVAQLVASGFVGVEHEPALEIVKEIDGQPRRFPVFFMIARRL
jgi:ubiquinone/menaquinone biosynthesis C-methylase UbiE